MERIRISQFLIGSGNPCFVIAEAGVNYNGDMRLAHELVDAAAAAGADAVKFQTFRAEALASKSAQKAKYQVTNTGEAGSQFEMLKALELPWEQHRVLKDYCDRLGIIFLSTPFDPRSADMLDELGVAAFKMSSGDLTDHPLVAHLARKGRPTIISTGMATLEECREALDVFRNAGGRDVAMLHCVSNYPADPSDINLAAMDAMRESLQIPVGYSDHTLGMDIPLAAVALGACILEKHLTLDVNLPGPDHRASMPPDEFKALVHCVRRVESALGDGVKLPRPSEQSSLLLGRKSLHWTADFPAGSIVKDEALHSLRPSTGLPPRQLDRCVGRRLARAVSAGEMVAPSDFEP